MLMFLGLALLFPLTTERQNFISIILKTSPQNIWISENENLSMKWTRKIVCTLFLQPFSNYVNFLLKKVKSISICSMALAYSLNLIWSKHFDILFGCFYIFHFDLINFSPSHGPSIIIRYRKCERKTI